MRSRIVRYVYVLVGNVLVLALILILTEGLASYILAARAMMGVSALAERKHTKYDPDLGWVNKPNVYLPDMYGPGVYLQTNSQGFRNNNAIDIAVPSGKFRLICSGDSFTLGP